MRGFLLEAECQVIMMCSSQHQWVLIGILIYHRFYNNGCPGNESNYELFFRFSDLAPVPQTVTELLDILSVVQFFTFFLQGCCSCLVPLIGINGMNANLSYDVQFFLRKRTMRHTT